MWDSQGQRAGADPEDQEARGDSQRQGVGEKTDAMGRNFRRRERQVTMERPANFKWSSQSYTLKGILNSFKLPVVVQCREETSPDHVKDFFFDLRQPILLYNKRSVRKVFSRCIKKGPGGTLKELMPEVVIPEDYAGWFKLSKGLAFDKPSPHKTIESLTRCNSEFFLCTTEFNAIVLTDKPESDAEDWEIEHIERPVQEGEVLRKTDVQKLNQMLLPESWRNRIVDNRYLMCIDEKDCELYVPLMQTGLFYEVSGNLDKRDNSVVQISDILDEMLDMPLYVRHILGDPPPISQFYSPCLKLVRVVEEETIMGATLDKGEDTLPLEIQTNSPIKFEIALNTPMLQASLDYIESRDVCKSVGDSYVTDMKLAVTFKIPSPSDTENDTEVKPTTIPSLMHEDTASSICASQRTSMSAELSELGEVEASSEFTIQWDPAMYASLDGAKSYRQLTEEETDCRSIESLDIDTVIKLNRMLGGTPVESKHQAVREQSVKLWQNKHFAESEPSRPHQNKSKLGIDKGSTGSLDLAPMSDIVDSITDFSMHSNTNSHMSDGGESGTETVILSPPSPFQPDSRSSSVSLGSSTLSIASSSSRSEINLSDHFPSINSSPNGSLRNDRDRPTHPISCENQDFTFTGAVFIDHLEEERSDLELNDDSEDKDWGNKFRVIKSKDLPKNRNRNPETGSLHRLGVEKVRSVSLSEKLAQFDSNATKTPTNGIITCQAADDMASSYNDLRLSLEEVTRNAHQNHSEHRWKTFCLERSCSLPVRSKQADMKQLVHVDEHSHSWEEISPRRAGDMSVVSAMSTSVHNPSTTLDKLNLDFDGSGDKAQLISDTSSEDSGRYPRGPGECGNSANTSFTISEASDTHDVDGPASLLAVVSELSAFSDDLNVTGSVRNGRTSTKERAMMSKRMKVENEIKRKATGHWNEAVFI